MLDLPQESGLYTDLRSSVWIRAFLFAKDGHTVGRKKKSLGERELEVLSARVRFDIYKQVETIAKREGLTLTQVVRKFVKAGVEADQKRGVAA